MKHLNEQNINHLVKFFPWHSQSQNVSSILYSCVLTAALQVNCLLCHLQELCKESLDLKDLNCAFFTNAKRQKQERQYC